MDKQPTYEEAWIDGEEPADKAEAEKAEKVRLLKVASEQKQMSEQQDYEKAWADLGDPAATEAEGAK